MNRNQLAEALYALPGNIVVKGRKSLVAPLLMIVVGAVLTVIALLPSASDWGDLKLTCMSLGGVILVAGAVVTGLRLFGSGGIPLYGRDRTPLAWMEYYYDRQHAAEVTDCMTLRDWKRLRELQADHAAPVRLVGYRTPDDAFVACRVFLYAELEERPLTDLLVADRNTPEA